MTDYSYETTGTYETTLESCTIYKGSAANIHRFYNVSDLNRILLDCIFPNGHGLPATASQALGTGNTLTLKWSFDLNVLDENENPIETAKVKIEDNQGNTYNLQTDEFGDIATQELIQAVYSRSTGEGNFDQTTNYNPLTITISKSGYKEYKSTFDITKKVDSAITLKKLYIENFNVNKC